MPLPSIPIIKNKFISDISCLQTYYTRRVEGKQFHIDDLDRTKLVNGRNAVKTSLVLFLFTNSK